MANELLKLDERTFDDLLVEAQSRITRYSAGQWTDFNDSDPGMTIVQLFAWLTEITLFRLNQVPDRTLLKLLETLNFRPLPARPAETRLTFVPLPDAADDDLSRNAAGAPIRALPQRTPVQADNPAGGEPIVFETKRGIDVIARKLNAIQVFNGASFEAIAQDLAESGLDRLPEFNPFTWNPDTNVALYLGFAPSTEEQAQFDAALEAFAENKPDNPPEDFLSDPSNPPVAGLFPTRLRIYAYRPVANQAGPRVSRLCQPAAEPATNRVQARWEFRRARAEGQWRSLRTLLDETNGFQKDGYIEIEGPGEIALDALGLIEQPHYWIRCRLESGDGLRDDPPRVAMLLPNTVDAINLETFEDEFVGVSEGVPDQEFELGQLAVLHDPDSIKLRLEYVDDRVETDWELKNDFLCSSGDDRHFTLDAAAGTIRFGDGSRGQIPLAGTRIIAVLFRRSLGAAGNLPPHSIKTLTESANFIESVANYRPAAGGRDVQSAEDFLRDAPGQLHRQDRAVTEQDYQQLALEAGSVAAARAVPLHHPDYADVSVPGAVTVVIVPESRAVPPVASPEQLRSVRCYLEDRRIIGTELFVVTAKPVPLEIRLAIEPDRAFSFEALSDTVRRKLHEHLNPLDVDQPQRPVDLMLGKQFYRTMILDTVLDIEGVVHAQIQYASVGGQPIGQEQSKPIQLDEDELLYLDPRALDIVPITPGQTGGSAR